MRVPLRLHATEWSTELLCGEDVLQSEHYTEAIPSQ